MTFTPLPGEMPRGRLVLDGHEVELDGVWMRAAFAFDRSDPITGYLFVTNEGNPFEEVVSITLTYPDLRILDRAWIGAPYGNAQWDGAEIAGPGRINFDLAGNGRWRLTVLPRPQWRLPLPGAGGAVWRGLNLRRHFRIEQITRT